MCVPLRAQDATLTGVVTDSLTNAPVEGARVDVIAPERAVTRTVTDVQGVFALSVPAGTYTVVITRLDYRPVRLAGVALGAGATRRLTIRLVPHAYVINPVVVSASRAEEKALDAPASVTVVDERSIAERPAVTPIDHVYGTAGLDVATTGIMAHEVVSRGFNNVSSGALLVLTDGRYAAVPSLRINVFSFIPLTDDDIERIELVRGPGSALYGPNSSNGVLHVLSRSPFESRPATLTLTGTGSSVWRSPWAGAWRSSSRHNTSAPTIGRTRIPRSRRHGSWRSAPGRMPTPC
jgi:iron complex outermembrane receptor protein